MEFPQEKSKSRGAKPKEKLQSDRAREQTQSASSPLTSDSCKQHQYVMMKIPYFKKGSLIKIKVILYKGSPLGAKAKTEQKITGLCIKKKNNGIDSFFVLKYLVNNESIIQKFPLYSPFVFFYRDKTQGTIYQETSRQLYPCRGVARHAMT